MSCLLCDQCLVNEHVVQKCLACVSKWCVCMLVKENYCTQELLSLLMFKAWNKMLSFFSILFLFVFSFFILKMTLG